MSAAFLAGDRETIRDEVQWVADDALRNFLEYGSATCRTRIVKLGESKDEVVAQVILWTVP